MLARLAGWMSESLHLKVDRTLAIATWSRQLAKASKESRVHAGKALTKVGGPALMAIYSLFFFCRLDMIVPSELCGHNSACPVQKVASLSSIANPQPNIQ